MALGAGFTWTVIVADREELRVAEFALEISMEVGPKFLHFITDCVPPDLSPPDVDVAAQCARRGMISVGDSRSQSASKNLGKIELGFTRVCAGEKDPHTGIFGAVEKLSFSHLVVARILMQ